MFREMVAPASRLIVTAGFRLGRGGSVPDVAPRRRRVGAKEEVMQALAALLLLPAAQAGFAGVLTALVALVGVGSGLAISAGEYGTGVQPSGAMATAQRLGGRVAAIASLAGCFYGGWRFGWAWGVGGYVLGIVCALGLALAGGGFRSE